MKKPRLNIFSRILLATLLPLALFFGLMLFLVNHIIYQANTKFARESIAFASTEALSSAWDALKEIFTLVEYGSITLPASIEHQTPNDEEILGWVRNMLSVTTYASSTWIIFEPGVYNGNTSRSGVLFIRNDDGNIVKEEIPGNLLTRPDLSPWYHYPLVNERPYYNTLDRYNYGNPEGKQFIGTFGYPVKLHDKVIAVAGIDILYEKAFSFLKESERVTGQRFFLLAEDGLILYAADPQLLHQNVTNLDFPADAAQILRKGIAERRDINFECASPILKTRVLNQLTHILPPYAESSLFLFSEIPESLLYHEARQATSLILAAGLIGMALLGASVFYATRNIVKPIKRLTKQAERIAAGQIDATLGDYLPRKEPRHEVDQLEDSMMLMVEQLSHIHELGLLALEAQFQRDRVEQASEAKDRFFANMSHEIRTPMNAILGMSELLLNEPLESKEAKYARDIKHASESLLGIINDVLDLSKLESGKLPLVENHYDFHALLEQLASLCRFLAQNKNLAFAMELAPGLPKYLYGDDLRLRQILLNIIGNAIKFTNDGLVSLSVKDDDKFLYFNVRDTGIGIKPEDIPLLFRPFQQLDDTDRYRAIRGTGLGLSISQNLAGLMGGEISVDSVPGEGSVFHINVAKVLGDPEQVLDQTAALQPTRYSDDARALVVDDSSINLDVAAGLLGLFNISTDKALSGREGIDMLKTRPYDIVFMDHMMPEMDGVETVERIRAMGGRFGRQVIVALTANAVIGTREMFLRAGMNDFLSKPIVKANLQAILYKWMPEEKRVVLAGSAQPAPRWNKGLDGREHHTRVLMRHLPPTSGAKVATEPEAMYPDNASAPPADTEDLDDSSTAEDAVDIRKPASETVLMKRARLVEGLNVDEALVNVAGDAELYLEVLGLVKDIAETIPVNLTTFLQERNFYRFRVEAHGAKGSLRNLGANDLADLAFELENLGMKEDYEAANEILPGFLKKFDLFAKQVEEIFS